MVVATVATSGMYSRITVNGMLCWLNHCKFITGWPSLYFVRSFLFELICSSVLSRRLLVVPFVGSCRISRQPLAVRGDWTSLATAGATGQFHKDRAGMGTRARPI